MKRLITIAMTAMMAFTSTQTAHAWGQDFSIDFGIRGGVNHAKLDFDYADDQDYNKNLRVHAGTGFFVGPSLRINLPICFGLDGSVLYDQKQVYIDSEKIKAHSISIPINLRLIFPINDGFGIYAAAGPQFAFNVGDNSHSWNVTSTTMSERLNWKRSLFSINVGGGLMLTDYFEVGFVYNIPMGRTGDATFKDAFKTLTSKESYKSKTNSWAISAYLHF
jgi:opacity protein-like surface antigen